MKACVIQPPYSMDYEQSDAYFQWELEAMDRCDESMDLIVMPESCDVPCYAPTREQHQESVRKYSRQLLEKAAETAGRCGAVLFINVNSTSGTGLRNTTFAFGRNGELAGTYDKQHLTYSEEHVIGLDAEYTYEPSEPLILEIDGIRYGFLTCYDFYFYENFSNIARRRPDIIIGCSHQRSDTQEALELMSRFCTYNTNAYMVRASVSMGEDSRLGGASLIAAPDGTVLLNMESRVGLETAQFDPHRKYQKPAGFGNPDAAHWEYMEQGRRPWKYRPAGSAIVRPDSIMPYPRVCAHQGFNTIAPYNSMPAYGAAVAMGADEIEFDLWPTADGEIVSIHDERLDRLSDGTGPVYEHTYEELLQCDFGIKFGETFRGMRIPRFEEILQKFARHAIMNIHIKTIEGIKPFDDRLLQKIAALIRKYDCEEYCYFMSEDAVLERMLVWAPEIGRCCGSHMEKDFEDFVDRAIRCKAQKIQLFKPYFNQEMIDRAHANGIRCNVFWADDPQEAVRYINMGIDTILTNDYHRVADAVRRIK